MTTIGNKAKLVTSEICQKCGKCCKVFTMSHDINFALRFLWTDNKYIKTEDTPFVFQDGADEKKITFKYPCNQLEYKDRKYYCKVWDKERPDFCSTYPDSIFYGCELWNTQKIRKLLDFSTKDCPALANISVEDVIIMLKEHRGL